MSLTLVPSTERLSNRDRNMLERAAAIAKQSTCKQKHGAVVYKSGRVLAVGVNATRNEHPTMEINSNDYTYHAEHAAYRGTAVGEILDGATVYVVRVNRRGNMVNSMPCQNCMAGLMSNGIKRVVYSA